MYIKKEKIWKKITSYVKSKQNSPYWGNNSINWTYTELMRMLEWAGKDSKTVIIAIFHKYKKINQSMKGIF